MGILLTIASCFAVIAVFSDLNSDSVNKNKTNSNESDTTINSDSDTTNNRYHNKNHCWNCKSGTDSDYNHRCPECGWYICGNCGKCSPNCNR